MYGLSFENQPPAIAPAVNRVDIACFVGFIARRSTPLPETLWDWLRDQGWTAPQGRVTRNSDRHPTLFDVPIPIESWTLFDQLFAWETRSTAQGLQGTTYLGAAVRSFFAQGGQRCYIVRMGDPLPFMARRSERLAQLAQLIPGYRTDRPSQLDSSSLDPSSWRGVGHLFGLPDVSFLCLPDLPDIVSSDREPPPVTVHRPTVPEQFVECAAPTPASPSDRPVRSLSVPRCDAAGYQTWARALRMVADWLRRQRREVQLVAAIPIAEAGHWAEHNLLEFLITRRDAADIKPLDDSPDLPFGLSSAFVQLVYPWVRSPGSANLPEQLEPPDGLFAGILARNALNRGTFRSVGNAPLGDVYDVFPRLSAAAIWHPQVGMDQQLPQRLLDRVSLLGQTPDGLRVLSDVTTSLDPAYRPASVNRLIASLVRAARRLGEDLVFEASGELLWARVREAMNTLLLGLLQAGALRGRTPAEAFQVRCDRTTMTQADLDQGRVIAEVQVAPSVPIDQITVRLILSEGGHLVQTLPTAILSDAA